MTREERVFLMAEVAEQLADLTPAPELRGETLRAGGVEVWCDAPVGQLQGIKMSTVGYSRRKRARTFTKDLSASGIAARVRRVAVELAAEAEQRQASWASTEAQLAREEAASVDVKALAAQLAPEAPGYPPVQVTDVTEVTGADGGYAYQVDLNFHQLSVMEAKRLIYTLQQLRQGEGR